MTFKKNKKIDLVILAGGKGSRIKTHLKGHPKPMLKFNSKPFIQYLINHYSKYNLNRIIILCGFRHKSIFEKYDGKFFNFIKIICLKEKKPMDTGGALYQLKKLKFKNFFLVNGDSILTQNPYRLVNSLKRNSIGSMTIIKNRNYQSNKLSRLSIKNNIPFFSKKGKFINAGVYYFSSKLFKYIKNQKISLEKVILSSLIMKKKINAYISNKFFIDIGSKKNLKIAPKKLCYNFLKPAAFLDRDGVINHDYGYVNNIKKFKFKAGVVKGLKYLKNKNYNIFVVTNQAGIGKKIFTEKKFFSLHKKLKDILEKKNIYFDDVQYSPYHINSKIKKFKKNSNFRKPGNLMIEKIKNNWDIDLKKSFMIGDKNSDKIAAKKSNVKFYWNSKNFHSQVKKIINNY